MSKPQNKDTKDNKNKDGLNYCPKHGVAAT